MRSQLLADHDAPLRFLRTAFLPDDWIAVLLKSQDTSEVVQRVGPVSMVAAPRFQSWLRFKNAHGFSVFLSVNALTPGRRSRTRESVGAVRHVFLDADQDAGHVLSAIAARPDLPSQSYVVRSSKGRAHVMWRVEGFATQSAEALQKQLARELGTDIAATSAVQLTRLPGFFNHKYSPAPLVEVAYRAAHFAYGVHHFPEIPARSKPRAPAAPRRARRQNGLPMVERARRYLAATPAAVMGRQGDVHTLRVCCQVVRRFRLTEAETIELLSEWNDRCEPPWNDAELAKKLARALGM